MVRKYKMPLNWLFTRAIRNIKLRNNTNFNGYKINLNTKIHDWNGLNGTESFYTILIT